MPLINRTFSSGFTLIEIAIGVLILSIIGIIFFVAVSTGLKETSVSSNHFTALMLSQKIFEDVIQEFTVNPHGHDTLVLNEGNSRQERLIDGGSVFFLALEDSSPPWGKVDSATDGGITSDVQPLHKQVKDFELLMGTEQAGFSPFADVRKNLRRIDLTMQWKGKEPGMIGKKLFVFSPTEAKAYADPAENIDYAAMGLEKEVKDLLPAGTDFTKPLAEIIAGLGNNERVLFEIGSTIVLLEHFLKSNTLAEKLLRCSSLRAKAEQTSSPEEEFLARRELADTSFEIARLAFQVVTIASKHLHRIANDSSYTGALTNISPLRVNVCYLNFKLTLQYFIDCLVNAKYHYQKLLGANLTRFSGAKKTNEILLRLFDIYRVLSFTPNHDKGKEEYQNFIGRVVVMTSAKNQFMNRFAMQELTVCADPALLMAKFPNLQAVHEILGVRVAQVLGFVAAQDF